MSILEREQKALEVYIKLLRNKGFDQQTLIFRTNFLNNLMPLLADRKQLPREYRSVVEVFMDAVPEQEWPESLLIAREYYPFWANDIKAVASMSQAAIKDYLPLTWKPPTANLESLWHEADLAKFGTADSWALKAYTKALRNENADQALIDTRMKLSKILLIRLADAPEKSNMMYRIALDATLPLFEIKKNRRLLLVVSREFYYFWAGNPEAEKYVLNTNTVSML
jgi:hypothetical protein